MPPRAPTAVGALTRMRPVRTRAANALDHGLVAGVDRRRVPEAAVLGHELADGERVLDRRRAHEPEHRHQLLLQQRVQRRASSRSAGSGATSTLSRRRARCRRASPGRRRSARARPGRGGRRRRRRPRRGARPPPERARARRGARARPRTASVDGVVDDARLLGGADHRRVEGLRDQQVDDRHRHVGARVQVDGRVAGADADARLAGRVGRSDRLGSAGRPDEVDAGVVEEVLRGLERRVGDDLERAGRQPLRLAGALEDLDRARRAARGTRRRPEDHRVARLGRDDRLEQRGRGRVRDRQQREHDADRLGDVLDRRARRPRRSRRPSACPSGSRRGTRWRCSS